MALDTAISLTTVEAVIDYLGIDARQDAFWIYYSGAATTATVQVLLDHLVLKHDGGTDANLDLTAAAYDTIGELVTYINASVANWEAGRLCHSSSLSRDLLETGLLNALGADNEQILKITGDYLIGELINRASDFLNRYWNRILKQTTYTLERYNGEGAKLFLNNYPVTAIVQVCEGVIDAIRIKYTSSTAYNAYVNVTATGIILTVDGVSIAEKTFAVNTTLSAMATAINSEAGWEASVALSTYNGYPSSQLFKKFNRYALNQYTYLEIPDTPIDSFDVDYEKGIIYLPSEFSEGFQNVFVSYTAGYSTIPYSAEQICIELVKYKFDLAKKDSALQSEKIGQVYAYTLRDLKDALTPELLAEADLFKRRGF